MKSHSTKKAADIKTDSGKVQMLRQQVQQLQHQLTVLSVSHGSGTAGPKQKKMGEPNPTQQKKLLWQKTQKATFVIDVEEVATLPHTAWPLRTTPK